VVQSVIISTATSKPVDQRSVAGIHNAAQPATDLPLGSQGSQNAGQEDDQNGLDPMTKGPNSICALGPIGVQVLVTQYEALAQRDYVLGSPRVDQLLTLVQFNVFRALISNTFAMGFSMNWLEEYAISPWVYSHQAICPASLRPSMLQSTVVHHPWIDLFPIPRMRDNLLVAGDTYDEYALCNDLVDFCDVTHEKTGLIVWREPWDPSGWEVTEGFLARWGWVVKGCDELAKSKDYWRMKRGGNTLFYST